MTETDVLPADLDAWVGTLHEPDWLRQSRRQAAAVERSMQWPHWDRTESSAFALALSGHPLTGGLTLKLPPELKDAGVILLPLGEAATRYPDLVREHLGHQIPAEASKLEATNRAAMAGCLLVVPEGVTSSAPVEIVYQLSDAPGAQLHPRTVIALGRTAEVNVIQRCHGGTASDQALVTAVVEADIADGAQLRFVDLQNWGAGVRAFTSRQAELGRDSRIQWLMGELGGAVLRAGTTTILRGIGGEAQSLMVFFASGRQHMDLMTSLVHHGPRTNGLMLAKGVLSGHARTVYRGISDIKRGAKDSNSQQKEQSLHLTDGVRSDAIPALYIDENELQAGHAATTGKVDPEHLFYLRSRGLPLREAERLIVQGFFAPLLERIPMEDVRREITALVDAKIDGQDA